MKTKMTILMVCLSFAVNMFGQSGTAGLPSFKSAKADELSVVAKEIRLEAENPVGRQNSADCQVYDRTVTEHPEISGGGYLEALANSVGARLYVQFEIPDTIVGTYNIYAVFVPLSVSDPEAKDSTKVRCTVYEKIDDVWTNIRSGGVVGAAFAPVPTNDVKSTAGMTKMLLSPDGQPWIFTGANFFLDKNTIRIEIICAITAQEFYQGWTNNFRIDCLLLEPVENYIPEQPVTGISLDKTSLSLKVFDKESLSAAVAPNNATIKLISWKSSNPAVAGVSSGGTVKGISKGRATITATSQDGNKAASCEVTVASLQGDFGENNALQWELSDDGNILSISGIGAIPNFEYDYDNGVFNRPWENHIKDIKKVNLGQGLTSIGNRAFYWCEALTSVTIPNSVTSIGNNAFSWCEALTSLTIPESITSIGESAFQNCSSLTSITIPESVTSIGDDTFGACSSLTSITIPKSVTSIGDYAFSGCSSLTSITIPESVTCIGRLSFSNCSSLTSVIIPNSVTSIGERAFSDCNSLASVIIPKNITSIKEGTFGGCGSLTSITIPKNIESIGNYAFSNCFFAFPHYQDYAISNCSGLTTVEVEWENPLEITDLVLYGIDFANATLLVPPGTKSLYEAADVWRDFGTIKEKQMMVVAAVNPETQVSVANHTLYINSAAIETVNIYSVAGTLLYSKEKGVGTVVIPLNTQERILIVRGSSGWVKRIRN
jgi:hypothetical protein